MNKRGVTLLEIMGVVAVIAILTTLVLPRYEKWKARSISAQAKNELTQLYVAEKTFKEEQKSYHWHLPAIGFVPDHISAAANYPVNGAGAKRYFGTGLTTQGTVSASLATFNFSAPGGFAFDHTIGFRSGAGFCRATSASVATSENAAFGSNLSAVTATTFKAVSVGCPSKNVDVGSANIERWTIDQDLNLAQVNSQN